MVAAGGDADGDPAAGRRLEVDRVVADTPAGNHAQVGRAGEHALGVGLAPGEGREDTGQRLDELVLRELAVLADPAYDLEPGRLEPPEIRRLPVVDVGESHQHAIGRHQSTSSPPETLTRQPVT